MKRKRKPMLDISGLSVRRGNTVILDRVSWRVEAGQHWVILGSNGSGKTSLLSALSGYLTPSAGVFSILGSGYGQADWRELRKRIGIVSSSVRQMMAESEPAIETVVSGKYAMIDFWGRVTTADCARALRILKQIECEHLENRPWLHLSQGERQRVLIGRALMAKPAILILDEPCAGLDPVAREHFLQFLERIGRESKAPTIVLVTHHVEEIMPVFSHALLLKAGRVLAADQMSEVMSSGLLSRTFDTPVRLQSRAGRYSLRVAPKPNVVI